MKIKKIIYTVLIFLFCNFAFASNLTSDPQVKEFINQVAEHYHFSPSYVKNILDRAKFNPEVINRMDHPYEAKPWYQYQQLFVTQERIDGGIAYWNKSNKLVAWAERDYGVPGSIVLAIIGIETKYGAEMGDFRVLDTLTTLAFHYPAQAKFFQNELAAFIALTNSYHINPVSVLGSYAGAMGQGQFMPSSYLYYAVDFQNNNRPNLFDNNADVIFSIANFIRQHGWDVDQPIAIPAKIIGTQFHKVMQDDTSTPTDPTLTLRQLADYGVYPITGNYDQNLKATLIKFQGSPEPEYWLTFHNFYVLTRYNTSNLYALAVYELSFKLQQAWDTKNSETK